jgi:hypothetical protein
MTRALAVIGVAASLLIGCAPTALAGGAHATRHGDVPADAPRALYQHEPRLPAPHGWPGPNRAFPRTSGTGRLAGGGFFWTDFLYDDHGTTTSSTGNPAVTAGSPSFGTYTYPSGKAANNGADIFRAAVLDRRHATYWRVDWNTLADPRIPIAEWTFDTDHNSTTGGSTWPAAAGVSSPGIDTALVMSNRRAELVNVVTGKVMWRGKTRVGRAAQSFVARVPRQALKPRGIWNIRLAAGLADAAGTGFAPAADAQPGQTHVFNVTFRGRTQEPIVDDYWDDETQTSKLATGDVSSFTRRLKWGKLAHRRRTNQAHPRGWSDRWYVSRVNLGPGLLVDPQTIEDEKPNYLGRVQPYAVYVPRSYTPKRPAPLTFLLHSLTQNQNQYAATTPKFSKIACEDRHSICATTLGRGPDGFYYDTAQLDFWQVWHAVAKAYRLDPDRTVSAGYSMGGIGTNELAMAHPDLFARAITLAGAVGAVPSLRNLTWVPTYLAGGAEDELVPVTVERAEANALQSFGKRYRWLLYPAIDHILYELSDSFGDAAHYMGKARRVRNPGRFTYTWVPHNTRKAFPSSSKGLGGFRWTQRPKLGVTNTGDYWLRHLVARDRKAESAKLRAFSGERPTRPITPHAAHPTYVDPTLGPAAVSTQTWTRGHLPARRPVIRLRLTNVRSLRVLVHAAGFRPGEAGRLHVTSDGPTVIRLGGRTIHVKQGDHVVPFQS